MKRDYLYEDKLAKLNLSEDILDIIKRMEKIGKSKKQAVRKMMPSIVMFSDEGCGASEIIDIYDSILSENDFYKCHLADTVLELVFPSSHDELALKNFLMSPMIYAENDYQSEFSGVFVIDFRGWKGRELYESKEFKALLDYIGDNGEIYYVFLFSENTDYKQELIGSLEKYVNLVQIKTDKPDERIAVRFLEEKLADEGYIADLQEIVTFVKKKVDFNSTSFAGYKTLNKAADKLICELVMEYGEIEDTEDVKSSDDAKRTNDTEDIKVDEVAEMHSRTENMENVENMEGMKYGVKQIRVSLADVSERISIFPSASHKNQRMGFVK